MTSPAAETDNQSVYNITVPKYYNAQKASSILRTEMPKYICFGFRFLLALSLFVSWVFTDNSDLTLSFDDLTFFANWFY